MSRFSICRPSPEKRKRSPQLLEELLRIACNSINIHCPALDSDALIAAGDQSRPCCRLSALLSLSPIQTATRLHPRMRGEGILGSHSPSHTPSHPSPKTTAWPVPGHPLAC